MQSSPVYFGPPGRTAERRSFEASSKTEGKVRLGVDRCCLLPLDGVVDSITLFRSVISDISHRQYTVAYCTADHQNSQDLPNVLMAYQLT